MSSAVAVVTGGAGFIGSHMVDLLLDQGYVVRVIDNLTSGREENLHPHRSNPNLSAEFRDIRTISATDAIFKDSRYVFHFAGIGDIVPSIERPAEYMEVNVQGTVRVLEAARHSGVRKLVYAASSSCYGLAAELPTTEEAPIRPMYPYALSKYQGEQALFHWGQVYHLPVNSIRIFNAYGTRSRTSGAYGAVFGVFLKQKLSGTPFTVVGDGAQKRDFLYASDVARAFLLAAEGQPVNEVFNLGAGNPQSVNRLVKLLGGPVTYVPKRPAEPDITWADISKIARMLGWQQRISFDEGVSKMLAEIHYWKNAPLWDEASIKTATQTWFNYMSASPK
jgi:UDP-glucose 4-epimerase